MANMSYCRFENTLSDLDDCAGALEDFFCGNADEINSERELRCAGQLMVTCYEILTYLADQTGCTVVQLINERGNDLEAAFAEAAHSIAATIDEDEDDDDDDDEDDDDTE